MTEIVEGFQKGCCWMAAKPQRLVLYGIVVAALILLLFPVHGMGMPTRVRALDGGLGLTMSELAQHLPEILDLCKAVDFWMALIGTAIGAPDAAWMYDQALRGMLFFLFAPMPFLVHQVYRSGVLAVLSPVLLLIATHRMLFHYNDWYFGSAITLLLGCMLLAALLSWQGRRRTWYWIGLVAVGLVASWGNVTRLHAGAGLSLLALFVAWRVRHHFPQGRRWLAVALSALVLGVTYPVFAPGLPNAFQRYYGAPAYTSMGPWHSIYIGLGWRKTIEELLEKRGVPIPAVLGFHEGQKDAWKTGDNPHDIIYLDTCAAAYVERHDPAHEVGYLTPAYMDILRDRYIAIWVEQPGWMLLNYAEKFFVCMVWTVAFAALDAKWILVLLLLAFVWLRRRGRRIVWSSRTVYLMPLLYAAFLSLNGMMAVPRTVYLLGSIAGVVMVFLLALFDCLHSLLQGAESSV